MVEDRRQDRLPDRGQVPLPDQGQVPLPDQGQVPLPDQGQVPLPDQGQVPLPDQGQVPLPDQGQVPLPPRQTADAAAGRPLRADAARNREKVLRAAREAFAESGYGVPLDEIAARAGVGPGTVYRHFPAKEALFEAVVTARITDLVSDARARADAADPGEAFFGFLTRIAGEAAAKRDLPDAIAIAGSLREDLFAALDLLLRRAQQAGAVRAGIRMSDLIVLLKGMFAGLAGSTDPGLHERVFAVLADGLRPPRPRT